MTCKQCNARMPLRHVGLHPVARKLLISRPVMRNATTNTIYTVWTMHVLGNTLFYVYV